MAGIREILKLGDPLLRETAVPVRRFNAQLGKLIDDMAATMYAANGIGLAAPQVGVSKCVVVIDEGDGLIELVNPEIVERSGEDTAVEYCLSVPEIGGEVKRAAKVRVVAQNRDGEPLSIEAEDWLARVLQHEIDHLHGRLFVDIMTKEVRD